MGETHILLTDESGRHAGALRVRKPTLWGRLDPEVRLAAAAVGLCLGLLALVLTTSLDRVGRYVATLFVYAVLTSALLPTPIEVMLVRSPADPLTTVLVASAGKTLGSLLVFLVGVNLNEGLHRLLQTESLSRRVFEATERLARRFGHAALFLLLALPLMSDTLILYAFAVLQMNRNAFLVTVFLASLVRTSLIVFGVAPGVDYLLASFGG